MAFRHAQRLACLALLTTFGLLLGCDSGEKREPILHTSADVAERMRERINVGGAGGGPAVAAADPTGFATIRGVFAVNGTPPQMAQLAVTGGDTNVCAPGGNVPLAEDVVVNDGKLANVLVYLDTSIPLEWEHEQYVATRDAVLKGEEGFDQKACIFLSHVFAMRSSQTVEIINSDPVGHNTNIQPVKGAQPSNNTLPANSSAMYSPGGEAPSPFPVTCSIHPWMKAWMITRDNPYFAVTKPDGSFEIPNVPAGVPLTFRVWQERPGFLQNVTLNGAATKWSKGRFKVTLNPGEDVELNVAVDAATLQ